MTGIVTPVTSVVTRRRVLEAANKLAKSNVLSIEVYEEILTAVGQQFSEDFGVDCKVTIVVDKKALAEKLNILEAQSVAQKDPS